MGSFRVLVSRSAEKDLRRVDKSRVPSIIEKIEALGEIPRPKGSRKLVGSECSYRVRSGDYRIIYTIDDGVRIVEVGRVRHRKEVYR